MKLINVAAAAARIKQRTAQIEVGKTYFLMDPAHHSQNWDDLVSMINTGADAEALVNHAVNVPTEDNVTALLWRN